MKFKKFFFPASIMLIILAAVLNGCGLSNKGAGVTPSVTPGITPAQTTVPTLQPSPTAVPTPSSAPTLQPSPTTIPSDQSTLEKAASNILSTMTLEEKIGQMFFVRCKAATAEADIREFHPGGLILFTEDFKNKTKTQVQKNINSYQKASELSLLIGVDEEGGTVNRVSSYSAFRAAPFLSPQKLFEEGGLDLIENDTLEKSALLKSLGINVNLAPVCDVSTNPSDFIYKRSFGKDAEETAEYVKTVVAAMNSKNMGCTLKHFPGYGNNTDTHTGIAIDKRSSDTFYQSDFLPFLAGIKAGAGSIMVSHNIVQCFDSERPASLSPAVHEILRDDLGFQGVILSDDLSMDAIKQYTGEEEAAVTAVLAGNDLLIVTDYEVQIPAVIAAVKDEKISESLIDEAVLRILEWKLSLDIISQE